MTEVKSKDKPKDIICDHDWEITHRSMCSFDFNEARCRKCGKEILEGGLMDSHCFELP